MNAVISYILALVFPGLGHWYIGKKTNAAVLAALIPLLFFCGVLAGGDLSFETEDTNMMGVIGAEFLFTRVLPVLGSLTKIAAGALLYLPGLGLQKLLALAFGQTGALRLEIATNFCLIAGLLNLLTVINLFYYHNRQTPETGTGEQK